MRIGSFERGGRIEIDSPAKVNLVLEVLGRRPDGYHEIVSILCPIDLWDHLEVTAQDSTEITLQLQLPKNPTTDDPAWQIPADSRNLAVQAADMVRKSLGIAAGCRIRLKKNIPAAAGLGGGSGNAAATVVACLLLWANWDRELAVKLCRQLGSDTTFYLGTEQGFGLMLAEGRGEQVTLIPESPTLAFWLMNPPQGCSTKEVYGRLTEMGQTGKIREFMSACENGQNSKIGAALFNALQFPSSMVNPWVQTQLDLLIDSGCSSALVTGSGSSCYGLVPQGGCFERLREIAKTKGISRIYEVSSWYGDSIEKRIRELSA